MKRTILFLITILITNLGLAQDGFNYKAMVTNNGTPVNGTVNVKVTIKNGNTVKWKEEHIGVQTDANGIFSIIIGTGNRLAGVSSFNDISWNPDFTYSIEVGSNLSNYVSLVTDEPFNYVPYAKLSKKLKTEKDVMIDEDNKIVFYDMNPNTNYPNYYKIGLNGNHNGFTFTKKLFNPTTGQYENIIPLSINQESNVKIRRKLLGEDSGDSSDMKAYIYGYVNTDGTINTNGSSDGFTVTNPTTGKYKITFDNPMQHDDSYVVLVTNAGNIHNSFVNFRVAGQTTDDFKIFVEDKDLSNFSVNTSFYFVVFKK